MTNYGLHIQLPMSQIPVLHGTGSTKRSNSDTPLYRQTRFAFLACLMRDTCSEEMTPREKLRPREWLVAIPLRQIDQSSYTRTTFNGRTLHLIEDDGYFNHHLPITSFDPVWIRRAVYAKDEYVRWPLSVKLVRFSLSCRSRTPLRTVTNPICKDTGNILGTIQGRKVDEATQSGQEDPLPLQLRIQGAMPTDKLRNQVIAIQSTSIKITDSPACYTVICFGLGDRNLWMTAFSIKENQDLSSIAQHVRFPTGQLWKLPNPGFCVFESSMGSFITQRAGNNPMYRVQYATYLKSDEEVSLIMNLSAMDSVNNEVCI
jgi:hypothetical protein